MSGPNIFVPVQARVEVDTREFIRSGRAKAFHKEVLAQDGGRSGDLETFTLLAKIVASGKWKAFDNVADVDGGALPQGIYLGAPILESAIQGADILDIPILSNEALFDDNQLVIENSLTLDTILDTGTVNARTVGDQLRMFGLIPISTIQPSGGEN